MPDYRLPASIALAAAATISASVNFATAKQEGKIKLDGPEGEQEYDPFNVTTPEDVAPGEPIDGPHFWSRVCVLTFFLTINACLFTSSSDSPRQVCPSSRFHRYPHSPNHLTRMVGHDARSPGHYCSGPKLVYRVIPNLYRTFHSKRRHPRRTLYPSCSHWRHHNHRGSRVRFDRDSPLVRNHDLGPTGGRSFMGVVLCHLRSLCGRLCYQSQYSTRSSHALSSRTNLLGKDCRFHHQQVQG